MNIKSLYETVKQRADCSQQTFLTHLNLTVRSLKSKFFPTYVVEGDSYADANSINDDIPVYEEYFPAIVANILFLLSGNVDYKAEFLSESDNAYEAVWSRKSRGKKIRDRGYYNV